MPKIHWVGVLCCTLLPRWAAAQEGNADAAPPPGEERKEGETPGAAPGHLAKERAEAGVTAGSSQETRQALDDAEAKSKQERAYGHGRQFGVRGGIVGGYRMVFRYDESPLCNDYDPKKSLKDQQKFCGHGSPLAAEVAVSFAPIDAVEPFLFGRFGLQKEEKTGTDPVLLLGAGLRVYTMADSAFKVFIEPALGAELEGGTADQRVSDPGYDPQYKKDVVFHLAAGPQYDFAKMIGAYLDAGITTGILRGIHSNLELQLGLQLRAP